MRCNSTILVRWLLQRLSTSHHLYTKSCQHLTELQRNPIYSDEYLKQQWSRQRECQLQVLVKENSKALTEKLNVLVGLEEKYQDTKLSWCSKLKTAPLLLIFNKHRFTVMSWQLCVPSAGEIKRQQKKQK